MSQDGDNSTNILADRRVHALIGLASGLTAALIAVLFLDGLAFWVVLAVAVMDAVMTPYMLGIVFKPSAGLTDAGERVE